MRNGAEGQPWFGPREKTLQFRVSRLLENTSKLGIVFKMKSKIQHFSKLPTLGKFFGG